MGATKKPSGGARMSKGLKYDLKIKLEGPGVHRKSIAIPELLTICGAIQRAVHRQAEAMEEPAGQTLRRGPITAIAQQECTLELFGISGGSTGLLFRYAKPQQSLSEAATFGADVLAKVAETVKEFGRPTPVAPEIDPGVLNSLNELGEVLERHTISRISLSVPQRNGKTKRIQAVLDAKVRQRIGDRVKVPTHARLTIEGRLEMADFKELGKVCRVHPPVGQSLLCSFEPDFEERIYGALRKPVKLTGTARLNANSGRPEELKIEEIEILDELLLGAKDFFQPRSLQQLAEAQGVRPLSNPKDLAGGWPADDNVDEFVASTYQDRS